MTALVSAFIHGRINTKSQEPCRMTKDSPIYPNPDKDSVWDKRKEMMVIMAETSFNPANICPSEQEELALFMVDALKSFIEEQ